MDFPIVLEKETEPALMHIANFFFFSERIVPGIQFVGRINKIGLVYRTYGTGEEGKEVLHQQPVSGCGSSRKSGHIGTVNALYFNSLRIASNDNWSGIIVPAGAENGRLSIEQDGYSRAGFEHVFALRPRDCVGEGPPGADIVVGPAKSDIAPAAEEIAPPYIEGGASDPWIHADRVTIDHWKKRQQLLNRFQDFPAGNSRYFPFASIQNELH